MRESLPVRTSLNFRLEGNPVPKARPRVLRSGITYTPKTTKEYEQRIGWAARAVWRKTPLQGYGIGVRATFGVSSMRPDIDNLEKSLLDGLAGVLYKDDKQVCHTEMHKIRANPPYTEVEIWQDED